MQSTPSNLKMIEHAVKAPNHLAALLQALVDRQTDYSSIGKKGLSNSKIHQHILFPESSRQSEIFAYSVTSSEKQRFF